MPATRETCTGQDPESTKNTSGDEKPHIAARNVPTTFRSVCLIAACSVAMVVHIANITSVTIALPAMGSDLNIPEQRLQWLVSAYSLGSGCFLLLFGRLADLHGRKKVFTIGSLCLTAFSLSLGFANDEITIDVLRCFQGIGVAATIPSAVGILANAFPPSRMRSLAFSAFAAGAPTGAGLGLVIGGALTEESKQTWRANFYFASGLGALSLVLGILSIDPDIPSIETDRRCDWLGALLVTAGCVLIVFVLSDGGIVGWSTSYIISLLVIGISFIALFVFWEYHLEQVQKDPTAVYSIWTPPPLMKPSIWTRANGRFAVMMTIIFLNWCAFLSWSLWAQLYYQDYLHLSPLHAMLRLVPMEFSGVLCSFSVAFVIGRTHLANIIVLGTVLTGSANLLFAIINTSSTYWAFGFPAAITSVFGADFVFAAGSIFIAKEALPIEQSMAGALTQVMTQIGTSFGVTITTIVFDKIVARDSKRLRYTNITSDTAAPLSAQISGYRAAQWTAFGFAVLSALLGAIFLRGAGVIGHSERDQADQTKESVVHRESRCDC